MAIWKKIKEFNNYSVSDDGKVRSDKTGQEKVLQKDKRGYNIVNLYKNGDFKSKRVHRLVAEAFLEPVENKECINHIDGNKLNNKVDNLEWCTHKENIEHSWRTGLYKPIKGRPSPMKGRPNPNGGLPRVKVMCVETGKIYNSIKEAQDDTGATHIYDVVTGLQHSSNGLHFMRV